MRFIDLFAGIGGIRIAFERAGAECIFSSEWDSPAQDMYEANFGERPEGDITKIDAKDVPAHDILTGGFPCQTFSIIGQRKGFADTRGTLFFDIERILAEKRPRALLLENVSQLVTHDKGRTFAVILGRLAKLDYHVHWKVLNALDYGVPHQRKRIIIVGFRDEVPFTFPEPLKRRKALDDVLQPESEIDPKHYLSVRAKKSLKERVPRPPFTPGIWHENKSGNIGIHPFSCALRANASYNYLTVDGKRRLTPREMLRLQGFPDSFKMVVSDAQVRKQAGNSVAIPKIEAVARQMVAAMRAARAPKKKSTRKQKVRV